VEEINRTVVTGDNPAHVNPDGSYSAPSTQKILAKPENEHKKQLESESLKHNGVHDGEDGS